MVFKFYFQKDDKHERFRVMISTKVFCNQPRKKIFRLLVISRVRLAYFKT